MSSWLLIDMFPLLFGIRVGLEVEGSEFLNWFTVASKFSTFFLFPVFFLFRFVPPSLQSAMSFFDFSRFPFPDLKRLLSFVLVFYCQMDYMSLVGMIRSLLWSRRCLIWVKKTDMTESFCTSTFVSTVAVNSLWCLLKIFYILIVFAAGGACLFGGTEALSLSF